jgi:hypothetical protein
MQTALSLGVNMTDSQFTQLATQAATFQWNQAQINQAVRASYAGTGGIASTTNNIGDAATMQADYLNLAGQYIQTTDPAQMNQWIQNAIRGGQNPDQFKASLSNIMAQQSIQMYPWMATAIKQGITPQQYLQPYTQVAASTLGISGSSINWADPKWQGALLQTDPKTGTQTPLNSDQFNKNLMQNPSFGYQHTQNAINQAYSTVNTIEQTFGAVKR